MVERRCRFAAGVVVVLACASAVSADGPARPTVFGQPVGAGAFTTRQPRDGETAISTAPFRIDKPGRYILTADVSAEASAIAIQAPNVTLDLNGHTVRFGTGHVPTTLDNGAMTYNSRQKGNVGHAGILLPGRPDRTGDFDGWTWNTRHKGVAIRNGRVTDGAGKGLAYCNGIDVGGTAGVVIENVLVEVAAPDTFGIVAGAGARLRNVTVIHKGTVVSNRHQVVADVAVGPDSEVAQCLLDGGPQTGVKVRDRSRVHHNLIRTRTTVTNGYGVGGYGQEGVRIDHNHIVARNGRGIHLSEKSSGWRVHDNRVEVREKANREYARMQTHGIKLEGTRNARIFHNMVLGISSAGGEPTPLNLGIKAGSDNAVFENVFAALTVNERGAYAVYPVAADLAGSTVRDNVFYTNDVCYYDGPDGGRNVTLRRCTFRRAVPDANVLFYASRAYKRERPDRTRFIDCAFEDGIDPRTHYMPGKAAPWRSPADYGVGHSLTLTVTRGRAPAAGAVVVATDANGSETARADADANGVASIDLLALHVTYDAPSGETTVRRPGPYTVAVTCEDARRTFRAAPTAPLSAKLDLDAAGKVTLTPGRAGSRYSPPPERLAALRARIRAAWKARDPGPVGSRWNRSPDR